MSQVFLREECFFLPLPQEQVTLLLGLVIIVTHAVQVISFVLGSGYWHGKWDY